ncbi:MAG: CAAX prenyl protease-related protein [Armatimonadota bacterium]
MNLLKTCSGRVAPMVTFIGLNVVEGKLPANLYPLAYIAKIALVILILAITAKSWRPELPVSRNAFITGAFFGVIGIALWIGIEKIPYPHIGSRSSFNPFTAIPDASLRMLWLATRFIGLAAVVPLIEELFWRGFLVRYIDNMDDYRKVIAGNHSWVATGVVTAAFTSIHPEWLAAVAYALLTDQLLRRTKSVGACVVMHAVTNLLLGLYVVTTRSWHLW